MPDFDFDTRKPQEPNEPNRVRIQLGANKLRSLLNATKPRIVLIANRVRNLLTANRLRTLLIGGGILLFVVVAVPVGLLIYSSSGLGDQQQAAETVTCDTLMLGKNGTCSAPEEGDKVEVCKADSRDEVDDETSCRLAPLAPTPPEPELPERHLPSQGIVSCDYSIMRAGQDVEPCVPPGPGAENFVVLCQATSRAEVVEGETDCRVIRD